jgi:hypothetical protein
MNGGIDVISLNEMAFTLSTTRFRAVPGSGKIRLDKISPQQSFARIDPNDRNRGLMFSWRRDGPGNPPRHLDAQLSGSDGLFAVMSTTRRLEMQLRAGQLL